MSAKKIYNDVMVEVALDFCNCIELIGNAIESQKDVLDKITEFRSCTDDPNAIVSYLFKWLTRNPQSQYITIMTHALAEIAVMRSPRYKEIETTVEGGVILAGAVVGTEIYLVKVNIDDETVFKYFLPELLSVADRHIMVFMQGSNHMKLNS